MEFSINDFDRIFKEPLKKQVITKDANLYDSANHYKFEHEASAPALENLSLVHKDPDEYFIQQQIRKAFGRDIHFNNSSIASHPDFKELILGGTKNQYITTMFVDIKGSTRLSLIYPDLEFIYKFKNAVIKACIEIIRSFDGHVHRIMGDAVLGFFGSRDLSKQQSILDCINSAAMLTVILENMIKPWLQREKPDFDIKDFGFRVGCNFGDNDQVLWGNYGYGKVGEISPTGLPVDLAAKLQSLAQKNQIMLGQDLLEYFNWPQFFTSIKQTQENFKEVPQPFITPNLSYKDGKLLNYTMRLLKTNEYVLGLPIGRRTKIDVINNITTSNNIIDHPNFEIIAYVLRPNEKEYLEYKSNSLVIEKNSKIRVDVIANNLSLSESHRVFFYKTNHTGYKNEPELEKALDPEDEKYEIEIDQEKSTVWGFGRRFGSKPASFGRSCSYKGLHTIKCEVHDNKNNVIFRDYIYVPIA